MPAPQPFVCLGSLRERKFRRNGHPQLRGDDRLIQALELRRPGDRAVADAASDIDIWFGFGVEPPGEPYAAPGLQRLDGMSQGIPAGKGQPRVAPAGGELARGANDV